MVTTQGNPVKILIANNDEAMRRLMQEALLKAGFEVVEAENGADTLKKFQGNRPDAVFLDANLSGLDGLEVCRSIRSMSGGEHVPILMVMEDSDEGLISRAFEEGATDFISRPLDGAALGFRTRYLLRAAQVSRDLRQQLARLQREAGLQQFPAISQPSVNRWFWNLAFVNYRWIRPRFSVLLPPWCLAEAVAKSSEETTQRKAQAAEFKHKIIDRTQLFA